MKTQIDMIRDMEKSLRIIVKIPADEEDRIIVNKLIRIRNSEANKNKDMSYIDKTIRYFLTEEEFIKYAINNKEITD